MKRRDIISTIKSTGLPWTLDTSQKPSEWPTEKRLVNFCLKKSDDLSGWLLLNQLTSGGVAVDFGFCSEIIKIRTYDFYYQLCADRAATKPSFELDFLVDMLIEPCELSFGASSKYGFGFLGCKSATELLGILKRLEFEVFDKFKDLTTYFDLIKSTDPLSKHSSEAVSVHGLVVTVLLAAELGISFRDAIREIPFDFAKLKKNGSTQYILSSRGIATEEVLTLLEKVSDEIVAQK
jgi:hypothetical protein